MVSVSGLERGYIRIQIGEKIAYVDAKYVRMQQETGLQDRRITELEDRIEQLQKSTSSSVRKSGSERLYGSSEYRRLEVFGGYSFVQFTNGGGNIDGWNASFTGNPHPNIGIKAEVAGLYGRDRVLSNFKYRGYSFMAGPTVTTRNLPVGVYCHALFGVQYLRNTVTTYGMDFSGSVNALSMAFGSGIDWKPKSRVGIRLPQIEYLLWHKQGEWAHNVRLSGGVIFRF